MTREVPADIQAEACVLGSMFLGGEAAIASARKLLADSDFFRPCHQILFRSLCWLLDKKIPADLVTWRDALEKRGQLAGVGGVEYLVELLEVPSHHNLAYYAQLVKDKSVLRTVIAEAQKAIDAAYSPVGRVEEVLGAWQNAAYNLRQPHGGTVTAGDAAQNVLAHSGRVERGEEPAGLAFGFPSLDHATAGGVRPKELTIIAAGPSVGKTALALKIAGNMASRGARVKIFSLEMSNEALARRWLAMFAHVNSLKILGGKQSTEDWTKTSLAAAKIQEWGRRVEISDLPGGIHDIQADLYSFAARVGGIDCAVIDYLQIVPCNEGASIRERISYISGACKRLAKEMQIPVILLSQLNRSSQQDARPPQMHDLKESSSIEQDADIVLLLHRPPEPIVDMDRRVEIWARLAKNRDGLTTSWEENSAIRLWFDGRYTDFTEKLRF